jgi:hypothetical protein
MASLFTAAPAFSQPSPSARLYAQAEAEVKAGNLLGAARLFEQAALREPHPVTHIAAARTYVAAGVLSHAADHFARALDLGLEGPDRAEAVAKLAELEKTIGSLRVAGQGVARLGDGPQFTLPARMHASAGRATLTVEVGTSTRAFEVELAAGTVRDFSVPQENAPRESAASPSSALAPAAPVAAKTRPAKAAPPAPSGRNPAVLATGIGFGVLGASAAGAAAGFWGAALSSRETYLADRTQEKYDSAATLQTATNVAWAVAIVSGAASAALLIFYGTSSRNEKRAASRVEEHEAEHWQRR